ncbi:hypothetical protein DFH06DRAFT_1335546 [Mycena polygramma]|nr:hypothetical protein DFH06DRAFT_1335546 [Mycena polygramma]
MEWACFFDSAKPAPSIPLTSPETQSTLLGAHPALEILGLRKHRNAPLLPHASPRWIAHHPSCIALPSTTLVASSSKFAASAPLELAGFSLGLRFAGWAFFTPACPPLVPIVFGGCNGHLETAVATHDKEASTSRSVSEMRLDNLPLRCLHPSAAALKPELVAHTVCMRIPAIFEVGITPEPANASWRSQPPARAADPS